MPPVSLITNLNKSFSIIIAYTFFNEDKLTHIRLISLNNFGARPIFEAPFETLFFFTVNGLKYFRIGKNQSFNLRVLAG